MSESPVSEKDMQYENESAAQKKQKRKRLIGCLAGIPIGIILLLLISTLGMAKTFAHRSTEILNSQAKSVYNAAVTAQMQLYEAQEKWQYQTTIFSKNSDRNKSGIFYQTMYDYMSDISKMNCAVICDEEGNVIGAMYSRGVITEKELSQRQTMREQEKYLGSLFRQKKAIGYYINGKFPERGDE